MATIALKKALQGILEKRHEKVMEERNRTHKIDTENAESLAKEEFAQKLSKRDFEAEFATLTNAARLAGFVVNDNGYGKNWQVTCQPLFEGPVWKRIADKYRKEIPPVRFEDLDAQIVALWLAEEDVQIRPLFNGELVRLGSAEINVSQLVEID